jgi:hypothetical protein
MIENLTSEDLDNIESMLEDCYSWEDNYGYENRSVSSQEKALKKCSKAIADFRYLRSKLEE